MTVNNNIDRWERYPAGPAVRMYLGFDESQTDFEEPSESVVKAFEQLLLDHVRQNPVDLPEELATLIDELYKMGHARVALSLHQVNSGVDIANQFHGLLALGAAALVEGDLEVAEGASKRANALAPQEIAPFLNVAIALERQDRFQEAVRWALAGLEVEKNYEPLWHLIVSINIRESLIDSQDLWTRAVDLGSWVGVAMLADATAEFGPELVLTTLRRIYAEGERSEAFLVDYTARLGQNQDFASINTILWELRDQKIGNWMLLWHAYQAQLAVENVELARQFALDLAKRDDLPQDVGNLVRRDLASTAP